MNTGRDDLQNEFLGGLMRELKVVWVFLVNGIKLTGQLIAFDQYVLALQSPTGMQSIFKSAVSTVCESHSLPTARTRGGAESAHPHRHPRVQPR
jgi:host factor-I protein